MSDQLAKYTFLPWMRQGLAGQLKKVDHLGKDADQSNDLASPTLDITLQLQGAVKGTNASPATKTIASTKQVQLYGPGDITGIERRAIVKTEPRHNIKDFESNFLPYIDFYAEDFLWRYTPLQANNNRLRPWLALVVLKEEEFEREPFNARLPLRSFRTKGNLDEIPFPPAYQLWAWAHVHVNKKLGATPKKNLKTILERSPNLACSRLICPRKLEPETTYYAFLIPSFEKGRLAGLGANSDIIDTIDLQLASWGHEQNHFSGFTAYQKRFPIYFEWRFSTGKLGDDFESLASKIVPRALHPNVGKRLIDVQSPGYNLFYDGGEFPNQGTVLMEGALRHPDSNISDLLNDPAEENTKFAKEIADLLNLEEDLKTDSLVVDHKFTTNPYFDDDAESIYDDPIITPPIYGRWHAQQHRVSPEKNEQWVDQLNLDPRHRLTAGLGAEIVRRNQEIYMDRAWGQYQDLFQAYDFLKQAQLTVELNERLMQKHFDNLHPTKFIAVAANANSVVRPDGKKSLRRALRNSRLPNGIFSSGYEKVTRRGGSLVKRTTNYHPVTPTSSGMNMRDFTLSNRLDAVARPILMAAIFDTALRRLLHDAYKSLNTSSITNWKWKLLNDNGLIGDYQAGNGNLYRFRDALAKIAKQDLDELHNYFNDKNWQLPSNPSINLDNLKQQIKLKFAPRYALYRKVSQQNKKITYQSRFAFSKEWLKPVMPAPVFKDPTYEELLKISFDDFVPNLDLIPPNTSGLLEVNQRFIESFLVGFNFEMARELFWREFPTDQRGTYFKMFWDSIDQNARARANAEDERSDVQELHTWQRDSKLGSHQPEGMVAEPLVLVIRGDLLNRYPHTIIYLEKAEVVDGERRLSGKKLYPIFDAKVEPDIFFLGFNLEKEDVEQGEGYFFVIQERPGELHFGLDSEDQDYDLNLKFWDQLNWGHLSTRHQHIDIDQHEGIPATDKNKLFYWGRGTSGDTTNPEMGEGSSADMAGILYQNPVKIAIHATAMLP